MSEIYEYNQEGEIYMWSYEKSKNFPGYHMAWTSEGKTNFQFFLKLLSNSDPGTFRTLKMNTPSESVLSVPNNRNSKVLPIEKLRIEHSNKLDWSLKIDESICNVIVSPKSANDWFQTIDKVKPQVELRFKEIRFWW